MTVPVVGYRLPFALLGAFRSIITDLHDFLAEHGHPESRPLHGFALQAVAHDGPTVAELGRRLGVTKQAAGQTVKNLQALGYVQSEPDPDDRRATRLHRTARGEDLLTLSEQFFEMQDTRWSSLIGQDRLPALLADLEQIAGGSQIGNTPGWILF